MQPGQALVCGVPISRVPMVTENLDGGSPELGKAFRACADMQTGASPASRPLQDA